LHCNVIIKKFADVSAPNASALLVISDADGAYPVIVNNITSPENTHEVITLTGKDTYKYKNCCAVYAPGFHAALIITRSGTVKIINCSTSNFKSWTFAELGESLNVSDKQWLKCSLGFSRDGSRAIALDWRGKLLMADFT
jgi:hypothetical protein